MPRILNFDSVHNVRDFGGYSGAHGDIALGKLYRTAHLANASAQDLTRLGDMDVGLIVDLRYLSERERQPNRWPDHAPARTLAFDATRTGQAPHEAFIQNDLTKAEDAIRYMRNNYAERPDVPAFRQIFADTLVHLAEEGRGVIIHCAAGKDRTGTLVALIQALMGVREEDIMHDYMLTMAAVDIDSMIGPAAKMIGQKFGRDYDPESLRPMFGVQEDYLHAALSTMGDPHVYAREALKLDDDVLKALRRHYIG